ncbi:MAG: cytochrome c family protein, partial [Xanthobacteraceae bacterium]
MASPSDRSSLKNWLPGVAGVVILFALAGYAGVSQGQREQAPAETAAAAASAKPESVKPESANSESTKSESTKVESAKPEQPAAAKPAPAASKTAAAPAESKAAPTESKVTPAPKAAATAAPQPAPEAAVAPAPAASPHAHGHDMSKMAQAPAAKPVAVAKAPGAASTVDGDAVRGRQVFKKCQACHSMQAGKNMLGPSLANIVGTKAGEVANYTFSTAMKQSGITWTPEKLDAYLADPQKVVPGNKMPFPGLKTDSDRIDVIAYLAAPADAAPAAAAPAANAAVAP